MQTILSKDQKKILTLLSNERDIYDNYIDPIQLGAQYLKAKELKDYPKMLIKINENIWQDFFIEEAKKLKDKIFE